MLGIHHENLIFSNYVKVVACQSIPAAEVEHDSV